MTVEEFYNTEEYKNAVKAVSDSVRKNHKKGNCEECLLEFFFARE